MTDLEKAAIISDDDLYRYCLHRWDPTRPGPTMCFVMLNPSTADGTIDDPTIRRCIGFGWREGCTRLAVVNLFAYRATNPRDLLDAAGAGIDPIGRDNTAWLRCAVADYGRPPHRLVAAWGAQANPEAVARFATIVAEESQSMPMPALGPPPPLTVWCLGRTKGGQPRHPLMLRVGTPFGPWEDWQ